MTFARTVSGYEQAEKAKIELSGTGQTEINLPYITADATGPKHVVVTLTKAKLESLVADLIEKLAGPCETCIHDSGISKDKIHHVNFY